MSRPRGRPRKSDDPATRDRLLDAATAACVDVGFEAVTLADVARRAGVTPAAIYNHFSDKADLLYSAGRVAIDRIDEIVAPHGTTVRAAHEVVAEFLRPSFRSTRRLILELHLAASRHPELAHHLAAWHREVALPAVERSPHGAADATAQVTTLFLVLLGCCHLEDLAALGAPTDEVERHVGRLVDALYAPPDPTADVARTTPTGRRRT